MTPLVYTPTAAPAIEQFSHIYRRPRGLFIPFPLRDSIPQLLRNRPNIDVDVIVVTDGERILGIGDQGAGGLGISIGKLSLYTGHGGIRPDRTLPMVLDVGTNDSERLKDPEYLGWRHERVTGQDYFDFVDQFVQAVNRELPGTCLRVSGTSAIPIPFGVLESGRIIPRKRGRSTLAGLGQMATWEEETFEEAAATNGSD